MGKIQERWNTDSRWNICASPSRWLRTACTRHRRDLWFRWHRLPRACRKGGQERCIMQLNVCFLQDRRWVDVWWRRRTKLLRQRDRADGDSKPVDESIDGEGPGSYHGKVRCRIALLSQSLPFVIRMICLYTTMYCTLLHIIHTSYKSVIPVHANRNLCSDNIHSLRRESIQGELPYLWL